MPNDIPSSTDNQVKSDRIENLAFAPQLRPIAHHRADSADHMSWQNRHLTVVYRCYNSAQRIPWR
jgi:formate-dependent phosphoribosylglycinamide formyltransferase (GAR transformylase)